MSEPVWLKWVDGGIVMKAPHSDMASAKAQAAAEAKTFLGIYDSPEDSAKKLADAKGANDG
jgi:hypothetical protein